MCASVIALLCYHNVACSKDHIPKAVSWIKMCSIWNVIQNWSHWPHDDVIKWKHFSRNWPFVRGIHREFPTQRLVTRSFDVSFDLLLNKRLSKQSWGWWFEMLSCPSWRHCNDLFVDKHSSRCSLDSLWRRQATLNRFIIFQDDYRQFSNIRRTKSQHLKDSRTDLKLSLPNPLKPDVKSRMKI